MTIYRTRWGIVHSEALCQEDASWDGKAVTISLFYYRRVFQRIIRAYAVRQHLPLSPIILNQHGCCYEGVWFTKDGSIQRWINEHDGRASALLILSCNAHNIPVYSKKSVLVHLNRAAGIADLLKTRGLVRLYHPAMGYIEDDRYCIRRALQA